MWISFFLGCLICTLVLYLPGLLLCHGLRLNAISSVCCAPVSTIALVEIFTIFYGAVGIECTWFSVLAPIVAIGAILASILHFRPRKPSVGLPTIESNWAILAIYIIVGTIVCTYVYVKCLDGAASYYCRHDNLTHYNVVRVFVESGQWSPLAISNFTPQEISLNSFPAAGFYPAAWHAIAAIGTELVDCNPLIVENALNAVIAGIVFPVSCFGCIRALFPANNLAVIAGAFVCVGFTAFPWAFFIKGPLYPNMLANAIIPALIGSFVSLTRKGESRSSNAFPLFMICLLGFIALALSQTNSLFTAFLFLIPYGAHRLSQIVSASSSFMNSTLGKTCFFVCYSIAIVLIWTLMYNIPQISSVTHYENAGDVNLNLTDGLFNTLSFSFFASFPQWVLVITSLIGCIHLIVERRTWVIVPALFTLGLYWISKVFLGQPKMFLAGFWYSDPWRIAACAALFLIPIASLGLSLLIDLLCKFVSTSAQHGPAKHSNRRIILVCMVSVLLAYSCYNYFPNFHELRGGDHTTAFGYIRQRITRSYDMSREQVYSAEEQDFVRKALETIPDGSLVINQPQDGSVFAYGIDGINTYYRYINPAINRTDEGELIRTELDKIASNNDVRKAVEKIGAKYVLVLDQDIPFDEGKWLAQYSESKTKQWAGINAINDSTPGFRIVLSSGDMRLYEIEPNTNTEG